MCGWTRDRDTDKEKEWRDGEIMRQEVKRMERQRGEEGAKTCWCGALLSGHILYIFLISFYGPLAQIELLQVMEMGETITKAHVKAFNKLGESNRRVKDVYPGMTMPSLRAVYV